MNNEQLREWVADPTRTQHELQVAAHGLGLPWHGATRGQLIALILGHLSALPAGGPATWSPPPPAPVAPAGPVPAPAAGAAPPPVVPPPAPAPAPAAPPAFLAWTTALVVGLGTVALIAIIGLLVALLAFRPAGPPPPPPAPAQAQAQAQAPGQAAAPAQAAAQAAAPAAAPAAPAAPQPQSPPPSIAPKLGTVEFAQLFKRTPSDNPGELIAKLDEVWDRSGGSVGGGSVVGNWVVPSGSIVWTNTQHQPVLLKSTGQAAPADKWVPLRIQGGWGVFGAYDDVVVPTPGRFARTDRPLNPDELGR